MSIWGFNNAYQTYLPCYGTNFFMPAFWNIGMYNAGFSPEISLFPPKPDSNSKKVYTFSDALKSIQNVIYNINFNTNNINNDIIWPQVTLSKPIEMPVKPKAPVALKKPVKPKAQDVSTRELKTEPKALDEPIRYNEEKGAELAREIASVSTNGGFDGYCARNVKEAIMDAGLGGYQPGHGYQMAGILAGNKNFREIPTRNIDLKKLPAGCVLVYDKGVAGYSSQYGHTEITLGNGTAASGGITHNIRDGARVFMPV